MTICAFGRSACSRGSARMNVWKPRYGSRLRATYVTTSSRALSVPRPSGNSSTSSIPGVK
jgi:hypothetical protein